MSNKDAAILLIKRCIAFADWAAGEGICPAAYDDEEAHSRNPDEFLWAYSLATGDEEWSTLAERVSEEITEMRAVNDQMAGLLDDRNAENERLRSTLYRIIELDHHNMGPESQATKIARAALNGGAA